MNLFWSRHSITVSLVVLSLSLFPLTVEAFPLKDQPRNQASSQRNKTRATAPLDRKLLAVESVPAETELDHETIPNTERIWRKLLSSASKSIRIGLYYLNSKPESRLNRIIETLKLKARQDVKIDVIGDSVFFGKYPESLRDLDSQQNIDVRILNLKGRTGGVMHGKYFLVDNRSFYVGSANFSWKSLEHAREIGLAGRDTTVARTIGDVFDVDWKLAGRSDTRWTDVKKSLEAKQSASPETAVPDTPPWIRTSDYLSVTSSPKVLNPPRTRWNLSTIVDLIESAEQSIFVDVFQYGLTSEYVDENLHEIDHALRRAATRGVRVHLLVSNWALSSPKLQQLKSLAELPGVTVKSIGFPTHSSGYISYARVSHPKMMIVDGSSNHPSAWVGSANWTPGYFSRSRNLGIVTSKSTVIEDLRRFFLTAWTSEHASEISSRTSARVPYHW